MGFIRRVVSVTPVMANAGAYVAGDQVGLGNKIPNCCALSGGTVQIESLRILDKAKAKSALSIFLFDQAPTLVGVDNAAFDMTDLNMDLQCRGVIEVLAANYSDSASNSVANVRNLAAFIKAVSESKDLFFVVVSRGTPTYADGDLVVEFGLSQGVS